jgi:dienelactone hydrolase
MRARLINRTAMKISRIIVIALAAVFILALARLARLENGGPSHVSIMLPGNEPATMYMPGPARQFYMEPPPAASERPPAIVLIHGFMADRKFMSVLARRLAENGYAVLAIDVRGHGENSNPFTGGVGDAGALRNDVRQAVDYLRQSPFVDGSRIAVMGHSMGAGATLDYASHDPHLKAAVMISGGWQLGPERPKNALFIFAEGDPDMIRDTSPALASRVANVAQIELGKTYGDFAQENAVEAIRVPGVDHVTIMYSAAATIEIVKWLDSSFGTTRTGAVETADARLGATGIALLLFVILLVPMGILCGSMVTGWTGERNESPGWVGLVILGGALIAAMPIAAANPASFTPVVIGDIQLSWFGVAGLIMVGVLALSHTLDWERVRQGGGATILVAIGGFALAYVCQVAMSVTFHHQSLSPERLMVMGMACVLLFPFWMGFELLVRRGGVAISTVWALLGRILIVVLMAAGVSLGVLPFFLMLILPIIVVNFVMIEIFSAAAYSASRNLTLIAVFETLWFAWLIAGPSPITFMF